MCMSGDVSTNWVEFREAWGFYSVATGLGAAEVNADGSANGQGLARSAATLCSVMGRECVRVMNSLPTLLAADKQNPARILAELSDHFVPQKNVLFERFTFNTAVQRGGESCDEFVVRLRHLAGSCEFGGLLDSLIRDRLVIGTLDTPTRDCILQERPVPDLAHVIGCLRASALSLSHRS